MASDPADRARLGGFGDLVALVEADQEAEAGDTRAAKERRAHLDALATHVAAVARIAGPNERNLSDLIDLTDPTRQK